MGDVSDRIRSVFLRAVEEGLFANQKELAEALDVSESLVSRYANGGEKRQPTFRLLSRIHETLEVDMNWLFSGTGSVDAEESLSRTATKNEHPPTPSPPRGLGNHHDYLGLLEFIHSHPPGDLGVKSGASTLRLIRYHGNAMSPVFGPHDLLLVDCEGQRQPYNGFFLMDLDGHVTVRRLAQNRRGAAIQVASSAPGHGDWIWTPETDAQVVMIGKVILHCRKPVDG